MKITLSLTGSSAAIAAAMQAFEAVEGNADTTLPRTLADAPSTSTGTGTPVAPAMPSAPSGATPMPTAPGPMSGTEDEGEDDDGTPAGDGSGLDSNGLPWDERIHSSSKKRGQDGTWNKRRGGPKGAELAAIEAELRAALQQQPGDPAAANGAPMPTAAPSAPPPPMPTAGAEQQPAPAPMPMPADPTPPAPPPPPMPTAAPTPAAEPPATPAMPAAAPTGMDFPSLMQQIGPKMGEGEGQINAAYLQQVCQAYGLGSLTDLALKPEMIDQIVAQFVADGRW